MNRATVAAQTGRKLAAIIALAVLCAFGGNAKQSAGKPAEGYADEQGNFVSDHAEVAKAPVKNSDWGTTPLGAPGNLVVDTTLKAKPEFRPAPVRNPGPTFVGGGKAVTIVAHGDEERALAEEIAWHLKEMSGADIPVAAEAPSAGPVVELAWRPDDDVEGSEIETVGDRVKISGAGAGLSHAVTYFLEELGIRYLWPGRLGKVIPKREVVVYPETHWTFRPVIRVRGIRGGPIGPSAKWRDRNLKATKAIGVDPEAYREAVNAAYFDRPGNRDFFAWHGVRDNPDCFGAAGGDPRTKYKWGHTFKWAQKKGFDKEHPDWMALQPDGTRELKNGRVDRPVFCLSNPDFIKRSIAEKVAEFKSKQRMGKLAITTGLPDGGGGSPCMCERCRRLDPVNAPVRYYSFTGGEATKYVSLTDRTLWFFNQIVDGVMKECPDKKGLTFFPYSYYIDPPVSVRPDPRLIALSVAGDYVDARRWNWARENVAAWINLGLETYWRPNLMWGWKVAGPQNYSRRIFDDFETLKANGLKGTDFDCVDNSWGAKGLNVYMNCRAALNPDRLDYATQLDDYCRAGFAAAANTMKAYFNALMDMNEAASRAIAAKGQRVVDFRQVVRAECYYDSLDVEALAALLAKAETEAASAPDVLARIALVRAALDYARYGKAVRNAAKDESDDGAKALAKAQAEYAGFVRKAAIEQPLAYSPTGICLFDPWMYRYDCTAKPKKKRKARK